ncbi:type II secretion system minor pseudopilin GspK [Pleionea sediminis]|uniref:type II secretion system minor pseudopilin GspK n=1 Tax=Pleionea sediminis TaxID=2569479 RepID=UPI0011865230|nr:type II secretion system minor pseudopilin GspK [Pleionea sediminis]
MKKQGGATLLIVLMVMALATLIATQLTEHSVFSKRRTDLMLGRDQAHQLALGGEALAKQWLAKGFGKDASTVHLKQPWATTPFEFPIEGGWIKGTVEDALTCFNLNSLDTAATEGGDGGPGRDGDPGGDGGPGGVRNGTQREPEAQIVYKNLLTEALREVDDIELQPDNLIAPVVDWIDSDINPTGINGAEDMLYTGYEIPYRTANSWMASKSELRVIQGYTADVYKAVKDYVCAIPANDISKININTVTEEKAAVLAAALNTDTGKAQEIISNRPEDGYSDVNEINEYLPQGQGTNRGGAPSLERVSVTSNLFVLNIEVEFKGAKFRMSSLVERSGDAKDAPFRVKARYFGEF